MKSLKSGVLGGLLLMAATLAALALANSAYSGGYQTFLSSGFTVGFEGAALISKPLLLWINDGLMAAFFLYVGLELKREMVEGKLSDPRQIVLPGLAAVGGMAAPALIYVVVNLGSPELLRGWAIPAATDIAFALGVLALVGARAPIALKLFLLTLAILDDIGAILVIALFYTETLSTGMLAAALAPLLGLVVLNQLRSREGPLYVILALALWLCVLKSGVHATLAGVVAAFFVPMRGRDGAPLLAKLEHGLAPYVLYGVLPLFAFANAGVVLDGVSPADLLGSLPLGVALGLLLGKQIGVLGASWLTVRLGWARLPSGVTWLQIYGVSCLAGIGFTMSLFIGGLAFGDPALMNDVRLGVLLGSLIAGLVGYGVLRVATPAKGA